MKHLLTIIIYFGLAMLLCSQVSAQIDLSEGQSSLYDVAPRRLVDMPTAGTLPRGGYSIGVNIYPNGGAIGDCNIGLSNRLMIGISFGAQDVLSDIEPSWNPGIEFGVKFRFVDEQPYFPAITGGFWSQGHGAWNPNVKRYAFKSRGFYAVASRSFYFYDWTAGWHAGINHSLENDVDEDGNINGFIGMDATFKYNLALLLEYDLALNDDKSKLPNGDPYTFAGRGRGYLNASIKWLFTENLELEALLKDLIVNRRATSDEAHAFTREIRITYVDSF